MINQFGQIPKWRMLYIIKLFFLIMNLPNVNNLAIKKKKKSQKKSNDQQMALYIKTVIV